MCVVHMCSCQTRTCTPPTVYSKYSYYIAKTKKTPLISEHIKVQRTNSCNINASEKQHTRIASICLIKAALCSKSGSVNTTRRSISSSWDYGSADFNGSQLDNGFILT